MAGVIYVSANSRVEASDKLIDAVLDAFSDLTILRSQHISVVSARRLKGRTPNSARALIVLLDADWLDRVTSAEASQSERHDLLHRLLAWAGRMHVLVFPVLLNEASMPRRTNLPADIAYLAGSHAMRLRARTSDEEEEDLEQLMMQVPAQLGLLQPRYTNAWIGSLLVVIVGVLLHTLLHHAWPLYIAESLLTIALCAIIVRTGYSPLGANVISAIVGLLGLAALGIGGAYLFSAEALSDAPRTTLSLPLAICGEFILLVGVVGYWTLSMLVITAANYGRVSRGTRQSGGYDYF
jgi:hypothetical protein